MRPEGPPLPRPPLHRLLSRLLEAAWRSGALPEPRLEPEALIADAGGGDDPEIAEPLGRLLAALRGEARLNTLGRTMAYGQIRAILADRRRMRALWQRMPEILERPLAPPIVVLGQMRSGTTRLHRLLAADRRFVTTAFHEAVRPAPPARRGEAPLRSAQAGLAAALLRRLNPALPTIHPVGLGDAEEQFGLLSFSLYGAQLEAQWRVPSFAAWWRYEDKGHVYRDFRRLLQTISWFRGDDPTRPWVLKAPQFMEDLDALLAIFPDARLLCLERDPVAVVASSCSLVWNQMAVQTDAADAAWVGREWLAATARRAERAGSVLGARRDVARLDVSYDRMGADSLGEMHRIYGFLALPLDREAERSMKLYLVRSARSPHRGHRYDASDFGLTEREIRLAIPPAR